MPTYTSISGNKREHTNWPLSTSGVSRDAASMLSSINGTEREIFSGMHVWERYSIKKSTSYETIRSYVDRFDTRDTYVNDKWYYCAYKSYSASGATFTLNEGEVFYSNGTDCINYYIDPDMSRQSSSKEKVDTSPMSGLAKIYQVTSQKTNKDDEQVFGGYELTRELFTQELKGSYIDTVKSKDENAYPENGISGGYWYVKIK